MAAEATAAADDLLARVEDKLPARDLLRRLLARELARLPVGEPVRPVNIAGPGAGNRGGGYQDLGPPGRKGTHRDFAREGVAFRVNLGANDRADARWLLPLICRRGGVTRREVGAIRIGPNETMFEIAGGAARDFALAASEPDPRARHVVITRADAPSMDARSDARPSERPALPSHAPEPHPRSQPPRSQQPPRAPEPPRPQQPRARRAAAAAPATARAGAPAVAPASRARRGPPRPHQPPRAPEPPRSHQPPRAPEPPRSHQPPRAPEPAIAGRGGRISPAPAPRASPKCARAAAAVSAAAAPRAPRSHPPGKSHDRPRPHPPGKSHERPHHTASRRPAGTGRRRVARRSRHTGGRISRRTRGRISRRGRTRRASRASTAARAEPTRRNCRPFQTGVTLRRDRPLAGASSTPSGPPPRSRQPVRGQPGPRPRDWNRLGRPRWRIHPSVEPRSRRTAVDATRAPQMLLPVVEHVEEGRSRFLRRVELACVVAVAPDGSLSSEGAVHGQRNAN